MLKYIFLIIYLHYAICGPVLDEVTPRRGETCGYESCPKYEEGFINVHIVPHTHDDVGWLKTVDQYYYGSRNDIQRAGVQYILDSVVRELWEDPNRKFIYVETAFFWKWWVEQNDDIRHKVHTLVRQGRLEFIGGAWSMNDEASTHYQSTIDQFTYGLRKLNDTFGECGRPKIGWQIDPFGHSREFANLLAGMNYDGLFYGRIDYQDKLERLAAKTMEMVFRGDDDIGKASDIFAGVLYNHYSAPSGFCFDVLCSDEPIIDDPDSPLYNVDARVRDFLAFVETMSKGILTPNLIMTMGEDFHYQEAGMWYKNLDKLIKYTNMKAAKDGLHIKLYYSTPSCYLKAVKETNPILPTKQDDFFPYSNDPTAFWTGYFTSRPTTKYFERQANAYLQTVKQLQVLAGLEDHNIFVLNELSGAVGVMQHHDAITGTEKEHVTHDYERLLNRAVEDSLTIARQAFGKFSGSGYQLSYERCALNQSQCFVTENSDKFVVTLYNPVGWNVESSIVKIPVADGLYTVYNEHGMQEDSQLFKLPQEIIDIPTRMSRATHELVFSANLPALGFRSYYILAQNRMRRSESHLEQENLEIDLEKLRNSENFNVRASERDSNINSYRVERDGKRFPTLDDDELRMLSDDPFIIQRNEDDDYSIRNEFLRVVIDGNNGEATHIEFNDGSRMKFNPRLVYYPGCVGDNYSYANRSSGAYIFRPNATTSTLVQTLSYTITKGPIFEEIRFKNVDQSSLSIRLYASKNNVEVEWLVGINIEDDIGKEYAVVYKTDVTNDGVFYTDSNGRQMIKRQLNKRPQYNATLQEPVPGNYYPITNRISLKTAGRSISVVTDRAQGGSSLAQGDIELMVHRRLLHDDAFGVGEALNETANGKPLIATGSHFVFFDNDDFEVRTNVFEYHLTARAFLSDAKDITLEDWLNMRNSFSGLKRSLPKGINLLTLEPWRENTLLLRLENYFESSDSQGPVSVDLKDLFTGLNFVGLRETTLAANQWVDDSAKWFWNTDKEFVASFNEGYGGTSGVASDVYTTPKAVDNFVVELKAKEIRTFVVQY